MRNKSLPVYCRYIILGMLLMILLGLIIAPTLVRYRPLPPIVECQYKIRFLGRALELYAEDFGGRFPLGSYVHSGQRSQWLDSLIKWRGSHGYTGTGKHLKCPNDTTRSVTSYDLNPKLAGHSTSEIPDSAKSSTPLLRERPFPGNHGMVYYLNGHVGTSPKSQ